MTNALPLAARIEAVLLFKGGAVSVRTLAEVLEEAPELIAEGISALKASCVGRGILIIHEGDSVSLATSPEAQDVITALRTSDLEGPLGKAGLETLAIVLYLGPISRADIEYIRGVQSSSTLRTLVMRGLIERADASDTRPRYRSTPEALAYLGAGTVSDIPDFEGTRRALMELLPTESPQHS